MKGELDPVRVAARLAKLAAAYVPETIEEGRLRVERERPRRDEPIEQAVQRRLDELRALDELTRYLHGKR